MKKTVKIGSAILMLALLTSCSLFVSKPLSKASGNTKNMKEEEILAYDKMYEGITINGIDIKDLSKEDTLNKIKSELKISDEVLTLAHKDFKKVIKATEIDFEYDYDGAVKEAFSVGRTGNPEDRIAYLQKILKENKNIEVKSKFNQEKMDKILAEVEKTINKDVKDGTISYEGGKASAIEGVDGVKVKLEDLKNEIKNFVAGKTIEVPTDVVAAKQVDKKMLESIKGVIGESTTNYPAGNQNRGTNIVLASGKLNEIIIMPGETFSFYKYVNNVTAENGYKPASTFIGNKEVDGIGGGICQVSSTLYMAALKADMEIVERNQHSLRVPYCPLGLDAMYYEGSSDLKFKNNFDFPVVILTEAGGGTLSFKILGDNTKKNYEVKIWNGGISTIPMPIKEIYDPNLPEGQRIVIESGFNGFSGSSYIQKGDGEAKLLNSDYYSPKAQIVKVGTKKAAPPKEKDKPQEEKKPQSEKEKNNN